MDTVQNTPPRDQEQTLGAASIEASDLFNLHLMVEPGSPVFFSYQQLDKLNHDGIEQQPDDKKVIMQTRDKQKITFERDELSNDKCRLARTEYGIQVHTFQYDEVDRLLYSDTRKKEPNGNEKVVSGYSYEYVNNEPDSLFGKKPLAV